jgi:predicted NUDIX family NTP pyrophosphohydrolase
MGKKSAGILLYRRRSGGIEVLLVHPGGPFWRNKDLAAWSIPKGGIEPGEEPVAAARREFFEETGHRPPADLVELGTVKLKSGKVVYGWAAEGDLDPAACHSNMTSAEWPPRSGKMVEFPEVDKAAWFDLATARIKINAAMAGFLDQLIKTM